MLVAAGAMGYALLFLIVGGLLRIECEMRTTLCVGLATAAVLVGLLLAVAGYAVGAGTLSEAISYSAVAFLALVAGIGFLRDRSTPT